MDAASTFVTAPQAVRIRGLLFRQTRGEHVPSFSSQRLESLSNGLQNPIGRIQFRCLALIHLLLAGKPDEIPPRTRDRRA
jgi:hypothetical protein